MLRLGRRTLSKNKEGFWKSTTQISDSKVFQKTLFCNNWHSCLCNWALRENTPVYGSDANLHYWNQSRLECSFMLRKRQVIYFRYNVRASSLHQLANAHQCALGRSHTQIRCSICKEDKAFFTISNNKIWHLCLREWSSHAFRSLSEAKHLSQGNYLKIIERKNFLNIRLNTFKLSWCHFVSAFVYTLIILIIWPH